MIDEWKIEDVPIELQDWSVIAEPNTLTGEIRVMTRLMGKVREQIMDTTNQQIRNALIDLGWTPPDEHQ